MAKSKKNQRSSARPPSATAKTPRTSSSNDDRNVDDVDYATTADAYFGAAANRERNDGPYSASGSASSSSPSEQDEDNSGSENDSDRSSDSEQEEVENQEEDGAHCESDSEKSSADEDDDSDHHGGNEGDAGADAASGTDNDEGVDEDEDGAAVNTNSNQYAAPSAFGEPCTFDLRNLLALNTHQVDSKALYSSSSASNKAGNSSAAFSVTIPGPQDVVVDEQHLLRTATDGCQQLLAALWQLPVERSDAGPLVTLPSHEEVRIPRALPLPPPKQETKWEKFAKERGIALNANKRSQKVWDEATGTWMFRHGYRKANDATQQEWPIMEVKAGQDPYEDPWERQRDAKRAKVDKNFENQLRNQERAGALAKGTTNKVLKNRVKARELGKEGGRHDRLSLPSGVPVDLQRTKVSNDAKQAAKRGKESTIDALLATQRSTASLGKFDKMREGEPERKKALAGLKKRKLESATDKKVIANEAERSMKVLKAVVDGGGPAKERAIKKGMLAKGETAYDYDFDDGLGASSFRKKKGRAGAGKMKKMTKKRVK